MCDCIYMCQVIPWLLGLRVCEPSCIPGCAASMNRTCCAVSGFGWKSDFELGVDVRGIERAFCWEFYCIVSVVYIVYFKTVTYLSILQALSYQDVNIRVTVSIILCMSEYAWKWIKGESRVHFAKLWYVQLVLSKISLLRVFCYFANIYILSSFRVHLLNGFIYDYKIIKALIKQTD